MQTCGHSAAAIDLLSSHLVFAGSDSYSRRASISCRAKSDLLLNLYLEQHHWFLQWQEAFLDLFQRWSIRHRFQPASSFQSFASSRSFNCLFELLLSGPNIRFGLGFSRLLLGRLEEERCFIGLASNSGKLQEWSLLFAPFA